VIAAILDSSQRALTTVQYYLTEHDQTAVRILTDALHKNVGNLQPRQVDQTSVNEIVDTTPWKKAKHELHEAFYFTSLTVRRT